MAMLSILIKVTIFAQMKKRTPNIFFKSVAFLMQYLVSSLTKGKENLPSCLPTTNTVAMKMHKTVTDSV